MDSITVLLDDYDNSNDSHDHAVATAEGKADLYRRSGAFLVDMESHIAARLAHARDVPFAALRVVADPAERTLPDLRKRRLFKLRRLPVWSSNPWSGNYFQSRPTHTARSSVMFHIHHNS